MSCSVVLDVGKTSAKLYAVAASGAIIAEQRRANATLAGPPYPHLDAEAIFDWALKGLARIAADHEIDAIVPVAHGACAALVAGDALALPVLDYEFEGVSELDAEYERSRATSRTRALRACGGAESGRQLFWLERRFPRVQRPTSFCRVLGGRPRARSDGGPSLGFTTICGSPRRAGLALARERGWRGRFPRSCPLARNGLRPRRTPTQRLYLVHRASVVTPFAVVRRHLVRVHGALSPRTTARGSRHARELRAQRTCRVRGFMRPRVRPSRARRRGGPPSALSRSRDRSVALALPCFTHRRSFRERVCFDRGRALARAVALRTRVSLLASSRRLPRSLGAEKCRADRSPPTTHTARRWPPSRPPPCAAASDRPSLSRCRSPVGWPSRSPRLYNGE